MKKHMIKLTAIMLMLSLTASGCNSGTGGSNTTKAADTTPAQTAEAAAASEQLTYPLTVRAGYSTGADDPRGIGFQKFKETVERETDGNIIIEIHPSAELGNDADLIAGLISKEVDMTVSSAGNYAAYATKMGVSALPFLFSDFDSAWSFVDSDIMQNVSTDLEQFNIHVLSYFDNGFRCVTTTESAGPVNNVADMEGLNIRTPENQIVMETMSALKANPRSFPFSELKEALKNGEFDAQENPIPVIYNNGLYEVQKYLSITNHSYDAMPLTIRDDIWKALKPEYRNILTKAAKEASDENRQLIKKQTEDFISNLEEKGMEVCYPDLEPFKEATAQVMDVFASIYGQELIDEVKKYTQS